MVLGSIWYGWAKSFDPLMHCLIDPVLAMDWCLHGGMLYGWDMSTVTPPIDTFHYYRMKQPPLPFLYSYHQVPLAAWAGYVAVIWPTMVASFFLYTRRHVRLRKKAGRCVGCDYNLRGNTSGVCPECGTTVANEQ